MTSQYTCDDLIFDVEKMTVSTTYHSRSLNYNECLLLKTLLDNANQVLAKEALKSAGWPDTIVTDSSLQKSIQKIRLAIAISNSVELKTVVGVGYMLSCECAGKLDKVEGVLPASSGRKTMSLRTWARFALGIASVVLLIASFLEFTKVTNTQLISYLNPDYELLDVDGKQVLSKHDVEIPPQVLDMIKASQCDCLYFFGLKNGRYNISVHDNATHRSDNYFVEEVMFPQLAKELAK
ncbi:MULTISPECIES: winged helix-turn-helix domain-containing protein [Vibrio]|uniref:winged helix-turn-helix domain-containing protein n=1 Tax=Vibrio TaxID=662 RepID=UPI0022CD5F74|nr:MULTISPECIES: helix-turn-helix domain-containing protein [unclassified Vibrio]MDA0155723.1 helix-turn-helix domain-containing protein [Vibrio sp. Makdt]CAH7150425.1 Helix-turn-helix domain-containing protein [Vibrio chagasii]